MAEWLLSSAAQIARVLSVRDATIKRIESLARECHFGIPDELVSLAKLRVLQRSDLMRLLKNSRGIALTDPEKILDADPYQFSGILPHDKVAALKESILRRVGETLNRRKIGHLLRCDKLAAIRPIIQRVYESSAKAFEMALEELLNAPLIELGVRRFTRQNTGQPDIELNGAKGTVVMSVTASDSDRKPISWDKAREVLGSVGYQGAASIFVVIGKSEFHEVAIANSSEISRKGERILLLTLDVLVEYCLRKVEGKLSLEQLVSLLEDGRGYVDRESLDQAA